ncbi:uncharacterized protein LOC141585861 [Silene latifolia]|uniref:uncharacterized protein LOC141585861 n=1 Tax=Silene latifolia TaxID=37657 RepID=UPI003D77B1A0
MTCWQIQLQDKKHNTKLERPLKMAAKLLCNHIYPNTTLSPPPTSVSRKHGSILKRPVSIIRHQTLFTMQWRAKRRSPMVAISAGLKPLDLTEENIETVLMDARAELAQLFDGSVGITGQAELADVDGPYVKIRLKGKFWHTRAMVLARLENYLKLRIPEILEVDIEDEKQLDDSPANF